MNDYDIVIVGGGISGIYLMYQLLEKKNVKVLLLESNERFGGRVHTHYEKVDGKDYVVDLGAGRLGFHHTHIMELVKKLNLEKDIYPIPSKSEYVENGVNKTSFKNKIMNKLYHFLNLKKIRNLSKTIMQNFSLKGFLERYMSKAVVQQMIRVFEYKSDFTLLNAYDSIRLFKTDYKDSSKFFVLKNGIQSITDVMISRIKKHKSYPRKFGLKNLSTVTDIKLHDENQGYIVEYKNTASGKVSRVNAKKVVCALPRKNLVMLPILKPYLSDLNSVQDVNLLRIYEIYEKPWFQSLKKTITNDQLQYVIPINPANGLIMTSYTDLENANYWLKLYTDKGEDKLKQTLREKIKKNFHVDVPPSKWLKFSYWDMGVGVWKKKVDSDYLSEKILNIMPHFYICGENYSTYQAWCEGALITSKKVFEKIDCELNLSRTSTRKKGGLRKGGNKTEKRKSREKSREKPRKNLRKITMDEVKKHNKKTDAWLVIEKKVYNVTSWISKHPGGMIIMKGVGKDATSLFKGVGHPDYVKKKILPKYLIGEI